MSAPFELERAPDARLLFEVPHAGMQVPMQLRDRLDVTEDEVRRDSDIYVDELCAGVTGHGADLLRARVSRYVVDLNRAPDDVDRATVADHPSPRAGRSRGVVWRTTTRGRVCVRPELDYRAFRERIERYYTPYHAALRRWLVASTERRGSALVVAAHSMPSAGRAGEPPRADVVPGSRGGTTVAPEVLDVVDSVCAAAGLSVRHDEPYGGGYTTTHYGRPERGWNVLQLEINRALYVDEETGARKPAGFAEVSRLMERFADELGALDLARS